MTPDAGEVSRMLAACIEALARELLPAGRRQGAEFVAPSPWGGSKRGLSVRLTGNKAGVWADFSGDRRGDALDLVASVQFGGDRGAALRWARAWLGLASGVAPPAALPPPQPAAPAAEGEDIEQERRRRRGLRLFLEAKPLPGTPAEAYLLGRGINLRSLGRAPGAMRFHPALWNTEAQARLPCLVAAITNPAGGGFQALHRTWIGQNQAGNWQKAALNTPKMALGGFAGGVIALWRGASGKPLAKAPADDVTVLTEGIENALSVAIACPQYRVLAVVSVGNFSRISLPPALMDLIVAADADAPGSAAAAALDRGVARLMEEGRSVRIARAGAGRDFNDLLRGAA